MSLACKCDRCNRYFSPKEEGQSTKIMVGLFSLLDPKDIYPIKDEKYDLCGSCAGILKKWLNEYKIGDNKDEKNKTMGERS